MTDEQRAKRLHHHMYETCEGIAEHAERIVALEELVAEMYEAVKYCCGECWFGYGRDPAKCENENCGYRKEYVAMRELGIEVK